MHKTKMIAQFLVH